MSYWLHHQYRRLDRAGKLLHRRSDQQPAEYHAPIKGLQTARQRGCTDMVVKGYSQPVVKHMRSE
ncbi:reverse transcriptase-like protein [Natrarchaeobius sp. A-rgal3]|uniref:reverse transcriptase-like protein n=1 Tax=Natrarchaeobius versutus TaxID=1679078 RepID=UPI00350FA9D2